MTKTITLTINNRHALALIEHLKAAKQEACKAVAAVHVGLLATREFWRTMR
jgi:hypothetical protein